jgi:nucleoside-diphosphate kinase
MIKEKTLILVKPDGMQRGLIGKIIERFESRGLKVVALKITKPTKDHIKKHYLATEEQLSGMGNKTLEDLKANGLDPIKELGTDDPMKIGKMINNWNFEFLSSGPVAAIVLQGFRSVEMGRKIVGHTVPAKADIGTIRGDMSVDAPLLGNARKRSIKNIVHASGTVAEAKREISHWFSQKEIFDYSRADEEAMF